MDIRNGWDVNEFILIHPIPISIFKCGYYKLQYYRYVREKESHKNNILKGRSIEDMVINSLIFKF